MVHLQEIENFLIFFSKKCIKYVIFLFKIRISCQTTD